jgi:TP901 family phage tail tape measure protein
MTSTGRTLTTDVTLPIVGIGYAATKAASEFQAAMTMLVTQAGLPADQLKNLTDQVQAFADSGAQQTPEILAQGLYHIVSLGVPAANAMSVLKLASEGAAMSGANLEDVANALGAAVASNIKGSGDYQQSMAILNATVGAGNMRMADLATSLGNVLPQATTAGLSLKDIGAAMATMTDNGMPAADAATRLHMAIALMSAPTGQAQKALESVNMTQFQLADDMRNKGLLPALQDLHDHLVQSGKTADEQAAVLSAAFGGGRSAGAIELLLNNLDRVGQKYDLIDAGVNKFGTDVSIQSQTAAAQFAEAQAKMSDAMVKLGAALLPLITTVMPKLVTAVTWLVNAFTSLPKPVQDGILIGLALLAVLGPMLIIIGSLITAVAAIGTVFGLLASGPVLIVIAAIAALGIGVYELIKHWQDLKSIVGAVFDWFGSKIDWLLNKIRAIADAMGTVIHGITSVGGSIGSGVSGLFSGVVKAFASGGIVNGPTLAMVGEAGPEAIIPLSAFQGGSGLAGGGGFGGGLVININGGYYLDQQASRQFADMIAKTVGQQLKLRSI